MQEIQSDSKTAEQVHVQERNRECRTAKPQLREELKRIASSFIFSMPESLSRIEYLLERTDSPALYQRLNEALSIAHQIRGSAGTLGLTAISEAFAVLEDLLELVKHRQLIGDPLASTAISTTLTQCRTVCDASPCRLSLAEARDQKGKGPLLTVSAKQEEWERVREETGHLILLIEDDPTFVNIVQSILNTDSDFKNALMNANNLAEAVQILSQCEPDIILLDLALPDCAGIDVFHKIHKLAPEVPILILTAIDDMPLADKSVALGAQDYLVKGRVSPEALARCIKHSITRFNAEKSAVRSRAIEDFNSTLAHDLRVPVQGADRILAHILSGHFGPLPAELENALRVMNDSNKNLLERLNRLLNLYRVEFGEVVPQWCSVDLGRVLQDVIKGKNDMLTRKHVTIDLQTPQEGLHAYTDQVLLAEVFDELVNNAVKFATDGDTITIRTGNTGERAQIEISNSGHYITNEERRALFKKFWKGSPGKTYVATSGLGLYYCHQIMNLLKGTITCRSNPGLTTFTLRLPSTRKNFVERSQNLLPESD